MHARRVLDGSQRVDEVRALLRLRVARRDELRELREALVDPGVIDAGTEELQVLLVQGDRALLERVRLLLERELVLFALELVEIVRALRFEKRTTEVII